MNKKKTFSERLAQIHKEATSFIEQQFSGKKRVIHLCDPDKDDGNCVYDMPDFALYDKHGFIDWCNIYKVKKEKYKYTDYDGKKRQQDVIAVYGIAKESGNKEIVFLNEIDPTNVIYLADWLRP